MAFTHTSDQHSWLMTAEVAAGHIALSIIGFALMVLGLGLSVTMIMLPVGLAVGLLGVAMFVTGLTTWSARET